MKPRYPLLAAMRAKAEREEAEIAAPHVASANLANARAEQERSARAALEKLLRNEMLPHVVREIGHRLGEGVHREILQAISKQKSFTGTTHLELPTNMLLAADPKSVVARVVDWWRQETAPKMRLRAFKGEMDMRQMQTTIEVRVPELTYRHVVMDTF